MKKVKLELDHLQVETFAVESEAASERGTVEALESGVNVECRSFDRTGCDERYTCAFACTWDEIFCSFVCDPPYPPA